MCPRHPTLCVKLGMPFYDSVESGIIEHPDEFFRSQVEERRFQQVRSRVYVSGKIFPCFDIGEVALPFPGDHYLASRLRHFLEYQNLGCIF